MSTYSLQVLAEIGYVSKNPKSQPPYSLQVLATLFSGAGRNWGGGGGT